MHHFAQRGDRAGSPHQSRPSSTGLDRQQIAANAKVSRKRGAVDHHESVQQQQRPVRRPSGGQNNPQFAPHQQEHQQQPQQQHRSQGPRMPRNRDAYDTDAESLDTTLPGGSIVQVKDSQRTEYQFDQQSDDDEEGESDSEDEEGEGDEDDEEGADCESHDENYDNQGGRYYNDAFVGDALQDLPPHMQQQVLNLLPFTPGEGNSYPTTTSGVPEDFIEGFDRAQGPSSDDFEHQPIASPTPQRGMVKSKPSAQAHDQPFRRPSEAIETLPAMPKNPTLFQQGANLRKSNHTNFIPDVHHGKATQKNVTEGQSSQPPTYSQATQPTNQAPTSNVNVHQNVQPQKTLRVPHRGAGGRPLSGPAGAPSSDLANSSASIKESGPARVPVLTKSPTPQPREEETSDREPNADLIENYDRPALLNMNYSQLKDEDFDTLPRAPAPVLSKDMLQKPLIERLEHVQKSLEPANQGKFFSSLPTTEWEDAGDWFLEQFTSVINQIKDARKTKRTFARAFEAEIEHRHQRVEKRHRQVEVALRKMDKRGEEILPQTPNKPKKVAGP